MYGYLYVAVAYSPAGQLGLGGVVVYAWDENKKTFRTVQVHSA